MSRHNHAHHGHQHQRLDPTSKRVYGPLWTALCDVIDLHPYTGPVGIVTLVGLSSDASNEELATFAGRLVRPLPGGGETAAKWTERHLPIERTGKEAFRVDEKLVAWGREDRARRLWAIVGLAWGLGAETVVSSFGELLATPARPRPLAVPAVRALVEAPPHQLPQLLLRRRGFAAVCAEIAADVGVTASGPEIELPAAMSAIAGGLVADAAHGVAACALLIRSRVAPGVDPAFLETAAREGTPAASVARLLARLWRTVLALGADAAVS